MPPKIMMRQSAARYLGPALLLVLPLLSPGATAEIYKWVDAQGNIHFGDKPKDARLADEAEPVEVVESYHPTERTPEEQRAFEEQQRKTRLRDEMRTRDDEKEKAEAKAKRDEELAALCADYTEEIDALETVKVRNGVRYVRYATDENGNSLTSEQQRERIALLKEQREKAGCT